MNRIHQSFLHEPAHNPNIIQEYLSSRRCEGEQLDFKSIPWEKGKGVEAAKDIAAFANNLGGDIILGIDDKGDCANGLVPIPDKDIKNEWAKIKQAMLNYLRPHEFIELVEIVSVATSTPNNSIITVSVPPSPHLIGVEYIEGGDKYIF